MSERILYTIGPSHYCEKARWGLERLRVSYTESRHPAILHWARTAKFRNRTVPILETKNHVFTDSTDILHYLDEKVAEPARLFPDDPALRADVTKLEELFDDRLGPQTRRLAYSFLVERPDLFEEIMSVGVSNFDARALHIGRGALVRMMRRAFKLDDCARVQKQCEERIRLVFDEVSLRIADGRPFLLGERFTAADLGFACMAAPALLPPNYAIPPPELGHLPEAMSALVKSLRAHPAGAYAIKLFERHRRGAAPGIG